MKILGLFLFLTAIQSALAFEGRIQVRNIRGSCAIGTDYDLNEVEAKAIELAKAVATAEANFTCMYYGGAIRKSDFKIQCYQEYQDAEVIATAGFECKKFK